MSVSSTLALALLLLVTTSAQDLPYTITSLQYPDSFHCFIKLDRGSSMQIYSPSFSPNHLKLTTQNLEILIQPSIDPINLLYNAPSSHQNSMGYIKYLNKTGSIQKKSLFRYAKVKVNGVWIEYLLSTLHQEIKPIRVDQLYRCSDILISVNWVGKNAQVWKFSQDVQWLHIDDLHGGDTHRDNGILYGYAVDQNEDFPIKIRVSYDEYCLLDRNTTPAIIDFDWSKKQYYTMAQMLQLVQKNIQVKNRQVISQQL